MFAPFLSSLYSRTWIIQTKWMYCMESSYNYFLITIIRFAGQYYLLCTMGKISVMSYLRFKKNVKLLGDVSINANLHKIS